MRYETPWTHYELPDFLPETMVAEALYVVVNKLDMITPNKRTQADVKMSPEFSKWFIDLYPKFCEMLGVQVIQPVNVVFQYTNYNNCDDSKRYDGGIHTDGYDKQISCLTPLTFTGSGTMLYNEKKELVKQVDWKFNTAFLFANKPTHWHSVGLANNTSRCMLNAIYYPKGYRSIHEKTYNVVDTKEHHKYR